MSLPYDMIREKRKIEPEAYRSYIFITEIYNGVCLALSSWDVNSLPIV